MPINKSQYISINLWTSQPSKTLAGCRVKHISLTINCGDKEEYVNLWPEGRKPSGTKLFHDSEHIGKRIFTYHMQRPVCYQQNYEQDCILEAIAANQFRIIKHIAQCSSAEWPYQVNRQTATLSKLAVQPEKLNYSEQLWAIQPVPANFRIVLFSLNTSRVLQAFHRLKDSQNGTGWSMIGPSFLTRNLNYDGKTSENCASIVCRCLHAGNFYNHPKTSSALPPSNGRALDDLLKLIITAKTYELNSYTGKREEWAAPGVQETFLDDDLIATYKQTVSDATTKIDSTSDHISSAVSCCIL